MCRSMVDIQSPTAEIRRGKKRKKKIERNYRMKILWSALFHRATIITATTPFKVNDFGTNLKLICDFLLVINTNLPRILHCFRDIAFDRSKIAICASPLGFNSPDGGIPLGRSP